MVDLRHDLWNWPQFHSFKQKPLNVIWCGWVIKLPKENFGEYFFGYQRRVDDVIRVTWNPEHKNMQSTLKLCLRKRLWNKRLCIKKPQTIKNQSQKPSIRYPRRIEGYLIPANYPISSCSITYKQFISHGPHFFHFTTQGKVTCTEIGYAFP